jgi:hypothetical protein
MCSLKIIAHERICSESMRYNENQNTVDINASTKKKFKQKEHSIQSDITKAAF